MEFLFFGESLDILLKLLSFAPLAMLFDRFRRSLAILPLVIKSLGREDSEVEIGRSGYLSRAVRISSSCSETWNLDVERANRLRFPQLLYNNFVPHFCIICHMTMHVCVYGLSSTV